MDDGISDNFWFVNSVRPAWLAVELYCTLLHNAFSQKLLTNEGDIPMEIFTLLKS